VEAQEGLKARTQRLSTGYMQILGGCSRGDNGAAATGRHHAWPTTRCTNQRPGFDWATRNYDNRFYVRDSWDVVVARAGDQAGQREKAWLQHRLRPVPQRRCRRPPTSGTELPASGRRPALGTALLPHTRGKNTPTSRRPTSWIYLDQDVGSLGLKPDEQTTVRKPEFPRYRNLTECPLISSEGR